MPPTSAKRARLQVIKKPLDYVPIIHTPNFPKMPILYMELIENKKKVLPELRNKEYIPKEATSTISPLLEEAEKTTVPEKFRLDEDSGDKPGIKFLKEGKGKKKGTIGIIDLSRMSADEISRMAANKASIKPSVGSSENRKPFHSHSPPKPVRESYDDVFPVSGRSLDENYHKMRLAGKSEALSQISESPSNAHRRPQNQSSLSRERENRGRDYFTEEPATNLDRRDDRRDDRKYSQSRDREDYSNSNRFNSPNNGERFLENPRDSRETEHENRKDEKEGGLAGLITTSASGLRLEDVLSGQVPSESSKTNSRPAEGQNSSSGSTNAMASIAGAAVGMVAARSSGQQRPTVAPSLTQIQQGTVVTDKNGVRDVKYATAEEVNEETKKQNLLFKFKILKRTYKEATIPEFSEHTPLNTLQREYDSIVRQLALDATVENYKKYLTIGFFVLEFVVANMLHLEEIRGFATQQMVGMNQYEKTLYLLGEQSALSGNKPWPPIVQLIIAIMINGAIYVGSKMFFRSTGTNIMNMLGGLGGQNTTQPPQQTNQPGPSGFTMPQGRQTNGSKPRMRGPDISLEDITGKKSV
jgi:hypothetical protein